MDQYMLDQRVLKGKELAEQIWWRLAKRIVEIAGELYGWSEEDWRNAGELFLRPNDYKVFITFPQ